MNHSPSLFQDGPYICATFSVVIPVEGVQNDQCHSLTLVLFLKFLNHSLVWAGHMALSPNASLGILHVSALSDTYPLFLHVSHYNKLVVQSQNSTNTMLEQWT